MLITNDGASVLSHLNVQHPVPRLLVELSKCQDEVAGDGTTSVVLLAAELLRCGFQLTRQSVPVGAIVQVGSSNLPDLHLWYFKGFRLGGLLCEAAADAVAICKDAEEQLDEFLRTVARTCIGSKIIGRFSDHFCDIAVRACRRLRGSSGDIRRRLVIVKAHGRSLAESELVDGLVLEKKIGAGAPHRLEAARVVVTRVDLDRPRSHTLGATVAAADAEDAEALEAAEREELRRRCRLIAAAGANVVINHGPVYSVAENCFAELGVLCVSNAGSDGVELATVALGCPLVSDLGLLDPHCIAQVECVEQIKLESRTLLKVWCCHLHSSDGL